MKPPPKGRHKPRRNEKPPRGRVERAIEHSERDVLPTRQQALEAAAQFLADLSARDPYENTA